MEKDYSAWLKNGYAQLQDKTDVLLCIENMPAHRMLGRRWNPSAWKTVEDMVRFPSITMDTTHLGVWGLDPLAVYKQWAGHVKHIHLSNYDGHEHRRPEAGTLQLDRLLAYLVTSGYKGAITIETAPDALDAGAEDAHFVDLLTHSLQLCKQWLSVGSE